MQIYSYSATYLVEYINDHTDKGKTTTAVILNCSNAFDRFS